MSPKETAERLRKYRAIPLIAFENPDDAALALDCVLKAGFPAADISFGMADAADLLRAFSKRLEPHHVLGAADLWNEQECDLALHAGAASIATCGLVRGLGAMAHAGSAAYLPGAYTPTEIAAAIADGADLVTLFPASTAGPAYLHALAPAFPKAYFCARGGIAAEAMDPWFEAGVACVSLDAPIFSLENLRKREQKKLVDEARLAFDYLRMMMR
jgi:2-dehydro-3-deoxyphosphogluconate aldolase/(4S)-4-hydroxy-2-oxoglutarate aldolase